MAQWEGCHFRWFGKCVPGLNQFIESLHDGGTLKKFGMGRLEKPISRKLELGILALQYRVEISYQYGSSGLKRVGPPLTRFPPNFGQIRPHPFPPRAHRLGQTVVSFFRLFSSSTVTRVAYFNILEDLSTPSVTATSFSASLNPVTLMSAASSRYGPTP